jgi:ATP/maltotriose-dependent transcriptional regulator MalT
MLLIGLSLATLVVFFLLFRRRQQELLWKEREQKEAENMGFQLNYENLGRSNLTKREYEVLKLLAMKMTNREIGEQLKISEHTVKGHVSSILTKLKVSNRKEAVQLGRTWAIIP